MRRAWSVSEIMRKSYDTIDFDKEWFAAFGSPEKTGLWFIWGNSSNGKSIFSLRLAKALTPVGKVLYNSLEEGDCQTMQNGFGIAGMASLTKSKFLLVDETIEEMDIRLSKPKSPKVAFIDSIQFANMTYDQFMAFVARHPKKLIIVLSQAEGKLPLGRMARRVMYAATMKIWVEGHVAFSKGRYFGPNGGTYVISEEKAMEYHGTAKFMKNEQGN